MTDRLYTQLDVAIDTITRLEIEEAPAEPGHETWRVLVHGTDHLLGERHFHTLQQAQAFADQLAPGIKA